MPTSIRFTGRAPTCRFDLDGQVLEAETVESRQLLQPRELQLILDEIRQRPNPLRAVHDLQSAFLVADIRHEQVRDRQPDEYGLDELGLLLLRPGMLTLVVRHEKVIVLFRQADQVLLDEHFVNVGSYRDSSDNSSP